MADQIRAAMRRDGAADERGHQRIWLVDKHGLITDDMTDLPDYQQAYARPAAEVSDVGRRRTIDLLTVVQQVKPTILIGTSTVHGAFTEDVVQALCRRRRTARSCCRCPTRPSASR